MAGPLSQVIKSAYDGAGAKMYLADLKKIRSEQAEMLKEQDRIFGKKSPGTSPGGGGSGGRTKTMQAETRAMKDLRETTALARIEFDKMNLANRRGELSNVKFKDSVAALRQRVTKDLLEVRQRFEELPRAIEVVYGRSLVTLDHFATRSQEVLSGQTRLRTRITQGVGDALRMQVGRLPGGHLLMGALSSSAGGAGIGLGALAGGGIGLAAAVGIGKAAAAAVRYEDALREVRKTTGMTAADTAMLGDGLLDLSVKLGMNERGLAGMAAVAGQLGIRGQEDILTFTETTAKLAAVSDLTAEEAAQSLGKIANAFGLPIRESERLGSVINQASNETAASSREIVDALVRVGPAGKAIGLAAHEVAGFAATLIDAGIGSEMSGTMIRNMLTLVQTKAGDVAKTLGVTRAEFDTMITQDARGTLEKYFAALQKLPPTLRTIEIDKVFGQRTLLGVQTFADATEKGIDGVSRLGRNMEMTAAAFKDATSLQDEYAIALDTVSGQWGLFTQKIGSASTAFGNHLIPAMKDGLKWLNAYVDFMRNNDVLLRLGRVLITPFSAVPREVVGLFGGASSATAKNSPDSPDTGFTPADILKARPFQANQPIAQTIKDRIAALEEEQEALLELGEATERLAAVNRELTELKEEQKKLSSFGVGPAEKLADRAQEALQKIAEAQQIAAAFGKEQKEALSEVFRLQGQISELKEHEKTAGAAAVKVQLEAAEEALRKAQAKLRVEKEFAETIQWATGLLNQLPAMGMRSILGDNAVFGTPEKRISDFFTQKDGPDGTTINTIGAKALRQLSKRELDDLARIEKALEKAKKQGVELEKVFQGVATSIRAIARFSDVFGDLSDDARRMVDGLADVLDNLGNLKDIQKELRSKDIGLGSGAGIAAQLPGYIGLAAGIASAAAGMIGALSKRGDEEAKATLEQVRAMRDLAASIKDSARSIRVGLGGMLGEGIVGGSLSQQGLLESRSAVNALKQITLSPANIFPAGAARDMVQQLIDAGVLGSDALSLFEELLDQFGGDQKQAAAAFLKNTGIDQALQNIASAFGTFGDSVEGAVSKFNVLQQYLGQDLPTAFNAFIDHLLSNVAGLDQDLRGLLEEAKGLDMNNAEDRVRLREIVGMIMGSIPEFVGGLTPDQLQALADVLLGAAEGTGVGSDEFTRSVQIARSITEIQAAEMVAQLDEMIWLLTQALNALHNLVRAASNAGHLPQAAALPPLGALGTVQNAIAGIRAAPAPIPAALQAFASRNFLVDVGGVQVTGTRGGEQLTDSEIDMITKAIGDKLRGRSSDPFRVSSR